MAERLVKNEMMMCIMTARGTSSNDATFKIAHFIMLTRGRGVSSDAIQIVYGRR